MSNAAVLSPWVELMAEKVFPGYVNTTKNRTGYDGFHEGSKTEIKTITKRFDISQSSTKGIGRTRPSCSELRSYVLDKKYFIICDPVALKDSWIFYKIDSKQLWNALSNHNYPISGWSRKKALEVLGSLDFNYSVI